MTTTQEFYKKVNHYVYDPSKPLLKEEFSTIYQAIDQRNNSQVILKVIPMFNLPQHLEKTDLFIRSYFKSLQEIQGEHAVKFLESLRTPNNLYVINENYSISTLGEKLRMKHKFTRKEACEVLQQISKGFLASNGQVHGDLKPCNVIYHEGKVKVKDFQFMQLMNQARGQMNRAETVIGPNAYDAPEIFNNEKPSQKSDVWAAGIMFYEMLFGVKPWTGQSVVSLYNNIKTKPVNFPQEIEEDLMDLLRGMLEFDQEKRFSWEDIEKHQAFKAKKKESCEEISEEIEREEMRMSGIIRGSSWSGGMMRREVAVFGALKH